ncbi:MAG: cytochrome c [Firmicutes bacterium]|nr:cytochrome c [Bacillota bacterium]
MKRGDRLFGTVVGWLIGLGMVAFAVVGFIAINQATPLSSSQYLSSTTPSPSAPTPAPSAPSAPGKASRPSTPSAPPSAPKGGTSTAQLASMGATIVTAQCQACHVIGGKGQTIGPDLDKVMAGQTVPGMVPGGKPTDPTWLARWIANPQAVWPSATMPNLGLTPTQVQAVVAFLTTRVK